MAQQEKKSLVKDLIDLAKQKGGQLTNQDILDAIGEADLDPEKLETLYETLDHQGIEIIDDMGDIKIEDLEIPYEDNKDDENGTPAAETGIAIDDPVKVYLKDIGKAKNKEMIAMIAEQTGLNEEQVIRFVRNTIIYSHGIATMLATGVLKGTEKEMMEMINKAADAFILNEGADPEKIAAEGK